VRRRKMLNREKRLFMIFSFLSSGQYEASE
jgi:hypothetical protein